MNTEDHYLIGFILLMVLAVGIVLLFTAIGNQPAVFSGVVLWAALGIIGLMGISATGIIVAMCIPITRAVKG